VRAISTVEQRLVSGGIILQDFTEGLQSMQMDDDGFVLLVYENGAGYLNPATGEFGYCGAGQNTVTGQGVVEGDGLYIALASGDRSFGGRVSPGDGSQPTTIQTFGI
jgi:hypothetical protein